MVVIFSKKNHPQALYTCTLPQLTIGKSEERVFEGTSKMKLLSAIVFLVLLIASVQVPIIADARKLIHNVPEDPIKWCRLNLPDLSPSKPCVESDCDNICWSLYVESAGGLVSGTCIPQACQCVYSC
ncbi:hypothetical protein AMTRI_Chr01g102910 [Amborella trichopoda]